jgi:hypothetical protein
MEQRAAERCDAHHDVRVRSPHRTNERSQEREVLGEHLSRGAPNTSGIEALSPVINLVIAGKENA